MASGGMIDTAVLLVALGILGIVWNSARDRARREKRAIEAERRQFEARMQQLQAEYEQRELERKDGGQGGEWMCDRLPCGDGELLPMPEPPPGEPKYPRSPDPMDPRPFPKRR